MTVILDTARIPPRDREDALQSAFAMESPQRVAFAPDLPVRYRVDMVEFGQEMRLRRAVGSPLQITRDHHHVRLDAPEFLAINLFRTGAAVLSTGSDTTAVRPGHFDSTDCTRPYRLTQRTNAVVDVIVISNRQAGVPVDVVRAARTQLIRSPLYHLVRTHVAGLFDATVALPPQPRLLAGQATAMLIRTLLLTAAGTRDGRDAMHDTLVLRIDAYIEAHLADHDLTVERIAAAHSVSVRQLYKVWARTGRERTVAQWIMMRRLERAREWLVLPERSAEAITSIARHCGFADASHFSRRFCGELGITPRQWRNTGSAAGAPSLHESGGRPP